MTLWIARLWFAAATVLFVVAAMYPMHFRRVLNNGHDQGLPDPRTVLFFQWVAKLATIGGILGFIESRIGGRIDAHLSPFGLRGRITVGATGKARRYKITGE